MKAIKQVLRQDKEPYRIPKRVQDDIPIKRIWSDGIFLAGTRYCKSFKFTDINYMVASEAEQKKMFLSYAALVSSTTQPNKIGGFVVRGLFSSNMQCVSARTHTSTLNIFSQTIKVSDCFL